MIGVPHAFADIRKVCLHAFAAVADFDESVQEARDQHGIDKQIEPRQLRGGPAIRVDRSRLVVRLDILRFRLELPIRRGQVLFIGLLGDGGAQDTVVSHRGRDEHFLPIQTRVFLVGEEIHGQLAV